MRLKPLVAAAALALSASSGFATSFVASGSFSGMTTDTFDFTMLTPFWLNAAGVTAVLTPVVNSTTGFDINPMGVTSSNLTGVTFAGLDTPIGGSLFQQYTAGPLPKLFAAGTYYITVTGTQISPGASYTGNVTVTAVPEPETYAMLLAGMGVVGFMAKRLKIV